MRTSMWLLLLLSAGCTKATDLDRCETTRTAVDGDTVGPGGWTGSQLREAASSGSGVYTVDTSEGVAGDALSMSGPFTVTIVAGEGSAFLEAWEDDTPGRCLYAGSTALQVDVQVDVQSADGTFVAAGPARVSTGVPGPWVALESVPPLLPVSETPTSLEGEGVGCGDGQLVAVLSGQLDEGRLALWLEVVSGGESCQIGNVNLQRAE